jgi:hypothetical protein
MHEEITDLQRKIPAALANGSGDVRFLGIESWKWPSQSIPNPIPTLKIGMKSTYEPSHL